MPAVVESWYRFDIRGIDDLSNAVLAANLEAIQMAGPRVRGSLAFAARDGIILGDTPQNYVRRLRLHRIRRELITDCRTTISAAAHRWGAGRDLGRLSRSYRDLFGENPS